MEKEKEKRNNARMNINNFHQSHLSFMSKDKHGWIRILESVIAIMILLGFFISLIAKQQQTPSISEEIYVIERQILKEASENNTIREAVLNNNTCKIAQFIYPRIPTALAFNVSICGVFAPCELYPPVDADVYADDILISSTLSQALPPAPLMLRLFVWQGLATMPECVTGGPAGGGSLCGNTICGDDMGEICNICPQDCCSDCVSLGNKIVFVGSPTQRPVPPSQTKITFVAKNNTGAPLPVGTKFKLRIYQNNVAPVDSTTLWDVDAADGLTALHDSLNWPSAGSTITIVYEDKCQDKKAV